MHEIDDDVRLFMYEINDDVRLLMDKIDDDVRLLSLEVVTIYSRSFPTWF